MAENLAVCIARQFGSGGRAVGVELANIMGISFYDKELLQQAAKKSGMTHELFERSDEKVAGAGNNEKAFSVEDYVSRDKIAKAVQDVILEAADKGPCVIIGRCADYVLRGRPGTVSVFIWADMDRRVQRIQRMHNLDEDGARQLIRKTDSSRANYYSLSTGREWGKVENFDIAVNAGKFGITKTAEIIESAAKLLEL